MAMPKKRMSHARSGRRRSHLALKAISLRVCSHCQAKTLPHQMCKNCGYYAGREVKKVTTRA